MVETAFPREPEQALPEVEEAVDALYCEGVVGHKQAFSRNWVTELAGHVDAAFVEARSRDGAALGRGLQRWRVEMHPQALRGFVDLVDHPWLRAIS